MTGFEIADDRVAVHFDSGIVEILDTCLKERLKTIVGAVAKARATVGFGPSRASTEFHENFWFRNEQIRGKPSNVGTLGNPGDDLP
jgi:hypothetical protein